MDARRRFRIRGRFCAHSRRAAPLLRSSRTARRDMLTARSTLPTSAPNSMPCSPCDAIRIYKPRPRPMRSSPMNSARACRRSLRLVQPLGCDGRRGLRFSYRMDQPHQQSGRIRARARRDPRKPRRSLRAWHRQERRGQWALARRLRRATPQPPARIDGAAGSA